jgi:hypothetical protein
MNSLKFSRFGVAALALCAVLTLSSCHNKTDQSAGGDSSSSPSAPDSAPSTGTSSGAASPDSSTTSSSSGNLGVAPQGTACPSGSSIKGITSKKLGGKIYLTTKSPEYSKIKPEKCFADVDAAKKAGYGAPK